jgi:pimeloyl-ACP methyl ester carboxylesterase
VDALGGKLEGERWMVELRRIETGPGLVFDVSIAGDAAAPLVLLLHGFAVSRHLYDAQLPALAEAGYFAVAPDQRGYSPGARPDPADPARHYDIELLIGDALGLAAAVGHGARRFHLVGHDWGGSLAWEIAARHPERLGSLTMLSRPHPDAFGRALREDPEQPHRSRHHKAFLDPGAAAGLLAEDAKWLRTRHAANGVPPAATERHLSVIGTSRRWKRRSPGTGPAAPCTGRSDPCGCLPCSSGATPTTRSGAWRRRAPPSSCRRPTGSRCCQAPGTTRRTKAPERVTALLLEHLAGHPL